LKLLLPREEGLFSLKLGGGPPYEELLVARLRPLMTLLLLLPRRPLPRPPLPGLLFSPPPPIPERTDWANIRHFQHRDHFQDHYVAWDDSIHRPNSTVIRWRCSVRCDDFANCWTKRIAAIVPKSASDEYCCRRLRCCGRRLRLASCGRCSW